MIRKQLYSYLSLLLILVVGACSPESRSPIARAYHNTTARYNGYFLAKERMKAVEATVAAATVNNYNQPLEILHLPDASTIGTITPDLEEIIKKASFPIQRHKNSKWVDDSYVLIGKARYYKEEYDEAVNTFKYAATISKDDEAKHEALIWLMRTFMANKEYDNAVTAADFLKKQKLTEENRKLYYLTQAQYHTHFSDTKKVIEYLEYAIPTIDKKDERSRIRFILAQLYQLTGQDKKAYEQYTRILRRNPPYELGFYSKLNLGQVTELSNASDRARIEKYYRKLLKDAKNIEYRDKIYYEMAKFERKQNKFDKALTHLHSSARASKDNPTQKGYSYLLAGQIYYENLQNYRLAQAYYDSSAQVLPPTVPEYAGVVERRDILTEFTTQLNTVRTEDSLQVLAKMDTSELNRRIDQMIAQEQERQRLQAEALAAAARSAENGSADNRAVFNTNSPDAGATASVWYFDNPVALGTARTNFIKKWGDRQLQDNWRTVSQRASAGAGADDTGLAGKETATADTLSPEEKAAGLRKSYLAGIPFGKEKLQQSDEKIEEALFALGNIYNHKLKEPARAIETYEQLLSRFPETSHAAETYYSLYLLYRQNDDEKQHTYANLLRQKFPKSSFARLIEQPGYQEANSVQNQKIRQLYDSAYTLYEAKKYKPAASLAKQITSTYPENEISDKISFLKVLLVAQTQKPPVLKDSLTSFIESYPSSNLIPRAEEMLAAFALYESGKLNKIEEPAPKPEPPAPKAPPAPAAVNYATDLNAPHYYVLIYPRGNEAFKKILDKYSDYNRNFNKSDDLSVTPYVLNDSLDLVVIREFANAKAAITYLDKQKVTVSPVGTIKNVPFTNFVISNQNFPAFYRSKNVEEYLDFFRKNYAK